MQIAAQPRTGCWFDPPTLLQHQRGECSAESNFASCLWRNLLGRYNEQLVCTEDLDSTEGLQDLKQNHECTAASLSLLLPVWTGTLLRETEHCWQLGANPQQIFRGNGKTLQDPYGFHQCLMKPETHSRISGWHPDWRNRFSLPWQSWHRAGFFSNFIHNKRRQRPFNEVLAQPKF